ncbi:MAG: alpha/beta hydrolase [Acidimicrobiales bacterium]
MADEQLTTAITNWEPRFTANGIDASDYAEVARTVDRWDDWCAAWSLIGARHDDLGRAALAEGRTRSAGEHLAQAATSYHFGKFLFVRHPEEAKVAHDHAVRCLLDALFHLDPPGRREVIDFDGAQLFGMLRLPNGAGPHPVVVLIPGLDSAKEEFRLVERSFLDRGVGTFAVDGPGQGEAEYALAIRPDWEVPGRAIVDHLVTLPGVDPDRIGVWGVSLGGYYAPRVAAGDKRVRACIALAGPYDFGASWEQLPSLTRDAFVSRSHSSRPDEAREKATALTLQAVAGNVECPLLVVFGKKDRLFGWEGAVRLSKEVSGPSELLLLEEGNHGCANGVYRHRPYAADWMARQLAV